MFEALDFNAINVSVDNVAVLENRMFWIGVFYSLFPPAVFLCHTVYCQLHTGDRNHDSKHS